MSKSGFDELDELAKILGMTEADPERKKAKPDQTKADGPSPEDSEFYPNFSEDDPDFFDEEIPARKEDIPAAEEKPATEGSASEGKSSPSPVSKPPAPPKPPEPGAPHHQVQLPSSHPRSFRSSCLPHHVWHVLGLNAPPLAPSMGHRTPGNQVSRGRDSPPC